MRLLGLGLGLLLAVLTLATAQAAETVTLSGRVVNRTPGGSPLEGAQLRLRIFQGEEPRETRPVPLAPDGRFQVTGLPAGEGIVYLPVVEFQGAVFVGEPVPASAAGQAIEVPVYDQTTDQSVLRLGRASLVILPVDRSTGLLNILELLVLVNTGDRAYASRPGAGGGMPRELVRFGLPPGADGLTFQETIPGVEVRQVDRGFALIGAIPPGAHELFFSYTVPYVGDSLAISRTLPYPTDDVLILVGDDRLQVAAPGLVARGSTTIAGRTYQVLAAERLPAGTRLTFTLTGLGGGLTPLVVDHGLLRGIGLVALLLGAALAVGYALRARARGLGQREQLLQAVAALDDRFAAGALDPADYRAQRSALLARLRTLTAGGEP